MSVQQDGNTLKIPIEISLEKIDAIEEAAQRIRDAKETATGGNDNQTSGDGQGDTESKKGVLRDLLGSEGIDTGMAQEFLGIAKNPSGWFMGMMRALPIIGGAFIIKEIAEFVYEWLTDYGRPLDTHFKRILSEEGNKARSRKEREEIRVGLRQVIFTHESGSTRPDLAFNSMEAYRSGTINEIDVFRIRSGRLQ